MEKTHRRNRSSFPKRVRGGKRKDADQSYPHHAGHGHADIIFNALDPVAESTADRKSFFARRGRSALDAHAYLIRDLSENNPPDYAVLIDVQIFYDTVVHDWLIKNIPMDKAMLRKFLKAGMILEGEMFPTEMGMSMASSLLPILGNMILDGLQSFLYDHLYPAGGVDYKNSIAHSWTRQGYKIKALHLETNQITFRRENKTASGITLPKALTDQPLPDDVAYRFPKLVSQFVKDNGL